MCPKGKADDAPAGDWGSWAHRASFSPVAGPRDPRVMALREGDADPAAHRQSW